MHIQNHQLQWNNLQSEENLTNKPTKENTLKSKRNLQTYICSVKCYSQKCS